MKVAILSFHLFSNYGGILQSYALQKTLEDMGHEVHVLQPIELFSYPKPMVLMPLVYLKRLLKKIIGKHKEPILLESVYNQRKLIIRQNTQRFIDKYINCYYINSFTDLKENDFDAYVVGSDQVWRESYFKGHWNVDSLSPAFLDFAKDWQVKKIAYSVSFGTEQWDVSQHSLEVCRDLVKSFDKVTVREYSGVEICRNLLNVKADWVLDPTLLLGVEHYLKFVTPSAEKKYLFSYFLDDNDLNEKQISLIKSLYSLDVVDISCKECVSQNNVNVVPPVEDWISGIANSSFVVTDSFHACVFAIIFQKNFFVVANPERGISRIESLLKMFSMEDRLVVDDVKSEFSSSNNVDSIIAEVRQNSLNALNSIYG